MPQYSGKKLELATNYIMEHIRQNNLLQGDRLPTEREMIEASGVSRVTLRRALANLQAQGLTYSIQGGGYYVGKAFRNLKVNFIPLVVSYGHSSSKILEVIQGAQDYLNQMHCRLNVSISSRDPQHEREIIEQYYNDGIRCIIVFPVSSEDNETFYFKMIQDGMNFIFIDRKPSIISSCNLVQSDNMMGGYQAAKHLIGQGHKRIAVYGLDQVQHVTTLTERTDGYRVAMREAGLDLPEPYYFYSKYQVSTPAVEDLLNPANGYTAVFALTDNAAIDIIQHAHQRGLRVPDDLAVIGFDNLDITASYSPAISTIAQPFAQLGMHSAQIAYSYLSNEHIGYIQRILPVELIVRESSVKNETPSS